MSCRLTSDKAMVPCHTCDQYQCITRPSTTKLDRSTKSNMSRASLALCTPIVAETAQRSQVKYFVNSSYNAFLPCYDHEHRYRSKEEHSTSVRHGFYS